MKKFFYNQNIIKGYLLPISNTNKADLLKIRANMLSRQNTLRARSALGCFAGGIFGISILRLHYSNVKYYTQTSNSFSNSEPEAIKLTPDFVTGFTDAEGSFMISILSNKNWLRGWSTVARFEISLHLKDEVLLNKNTENEVEILYYERPTELKFEKNLAEGNHCLQTQYMCNTANPYYNYFGDSVVRVLKLSCRFRQVLDP